MSSAAAVVGGKEQACGNRGSCGCRGGRSAAYLAALTLVAWGIQIPMTLLAVPKFTERLTDLGVQLPEVSRLVINWSHWMGAEQSATKLTGALFYGVAVLLLAVVAFAIAKVGGRPGRAVVVMLALLGGAVACGQAAAVIVPTLSAQRAIGSAEQTP